jgi:hypothetical protein
MAQVPLHRRFIESVLVSEYGSKPSDVTRFLTSVAALEHEHIAMTEMKVHGETNHIYSLGEPPAVPGRVLADLIAYRQHYFRANVIGRVAEHFVRSCLKWTRRYERVTRVRMVGELRDGDQKNAVDLFATEKATGIRYAISVKNINEWIHPGAPAIKDAWNKAAAHDAKPWLIAPFIVPRALERCETNPRYPIRASAIGAQILPKRIDGRSTRLLLKEVAAIIGPQPFLLHGDRLDPRSLPKLFIDSLMR